MVETTKSTSERVVIGARFFDWQVTANVVVIEGGTPHYPRCKVEASGAIYTARVDALGPPRDYKKEQG